MRYNVGQKAITKHHQEDVTILEVTNDGEYVASMDRFTDEVVSFSYHEHDLTPWRPRRYRVDGSHPNQLVDANKGMEMVHGGTWGIKDTHTDTIVFYVTSPSSKMIALEICDAMNSGTLLTSISKKKVH